MLARSACRGRLLGSSAAAHRLASWSSRACRQARALHGRSSEQHKPASVEIRGETYATAKPWFNVPRNILEATSARLHLQPDHPVSITRQIIESHFPAPTFKHYNDFSPVVSTRQNFDSLGFPPDHPGRAPSDTYYLSETQLLRTHTSAHQADTFRADESDGYLISADVYRRDAIDRSHYPIFHQMEGARSWDRTRVPGGDIAAAVLADLETLPRHGVVVEDPNPPMHPERNPLQDRHHSAAEAEAISRHLKRSLENMVVDIFGRAKAAAARKADSSAVAAAAGNEKDGKDGKDGEDGRVDDEPLRMRWVEAYFPFTSPSWELEVYYAGDWLEVLGCGVVRQELYENAGVPAQLGWAFGIGIDRIAMLLFGIPDIRLFWSRDRRFLSQFAGVSASPDALRCFAPFSKHPPCPKDVSFWVGGASSEVTGGSTGGGSPSSSPSSSAFHENDVMELVRSIGGDVVEDVRLIDEFTHPKTGRRSMAYRIVYRSLERTLTNEEANGYHERIRRALRDELGVELR